MSDIKVGDKIQWECRGMAMFKEPPAVRDFSPCGKYLFVENETCGLPVGECTKVVTEAEEDEEFTFFWHGILSQWHKCRFVIGGVEYNCAEQFMMAEKARIFNDPDSLREIMRAKDPADQKRLGRNVKNFIKDKWEKVARGAVYQSNYAKFKQNKDLRDALFTTKGTTLVEASPYDQIWGIGLKMNDERALSRKTWKGKNWLGEVLTQVREDLMKEEECRKTPK
jgi:ribA/ribD-fused uncharacterized protein